ncbi:DUF3052 domain-containing protein [Salipaludibacillus sp. HK11]|uniref:DUF3052 domain-containing protein n=1 Tax=Salipaludibacillus sp. HK11 TaxID=3394320 RepID=UPI0039FD3F34
MNPILKKMQIKEPQITSVINHPEEFTETLEDLRRYTKVELAPVSTSIYDCIIVFVKSENDIASHCAFIQNQLAENGLLWFVYPKKTSKKYKVEINRDYGWSSIQECGYEGVRQVAIDEDWSALRFRHVDYISVKKKK